MMKEAFSSTISNVTLINAIAAFLIIMIVLVIVIAEMWKTNKSVKSDIASNVDRIILININNYEDANNIIGKSLEEKLRYLDEKTTSSSNIIRKEGINI